MLWMLLNYINSLVAITLKHQNFKKSNYTRYTQIRTSKLLEGITIPVMPTRFYNLLFTEIKSATQIIPTIPIMPTRFYNLSLQKIESINRESYKDNISDEFSNSLYKSMARSEKNYYASSLISIKRRLRDVRPPGCLTKSFIKEKLPKASIVIIFCNELLTFVLRATWSVLNQTPRELLHEIILVDDGSNDTDIIDVLPWYIEHRFQNENVHLIRNPVQKHLVGAKLIGAQNATGETIVFLEGHMEVTPGWIEPLLDQIRKNPYSVAIPMLDFIDFSTLELLERVCKKIATS